MTGFMTPIRRSTGLLTAAFAALMLPAAPVYAETGQSFLDNFETMDTGRWYVSHGWANGDHQNCVWSKDQVSVDAGNLALRYSALPDGERLEERNFVCGEVQSRERFGPGTYEIRMKAIEAPGFNSAFFTYIGPSDDEQHHEIDFEVLGKDASAVQLNQYIDGKGGNEKLVPVEGGAAADFHIYSFVWERDRLRYFVDGELVHEVSDPAVIPNEPMKIFASLWASETFDDWLGEFAAPGRPLAMEIDWIGYTAPDEKCLFRSSVTCELP